ncbi:MAG: glycerophosphodiester phosphodiesterase, partial [Lachnospiraceae bacterium]|nr:glycerophosphodiester phosphodiesterase [Lachnospiraceae bacterium]
TFEELQQFTLYNTRESIPKLTDVLQLINGRVPLIVELKIAGRDISLCPIADEILKEYKGKYCIESFNPLGVGWYRKNRPEIVRGQLADAFMKGKEYNGILYFLLQTLMLNFISRPDFVAYNHKYPHMLSRRICRYFYKNTAAAWTIQSEQELKEAKKHFDLFIFDSFVPAKESIL